MKFKPSKLTIILLIIFSLYHNLPYYFMLFLYNSSINTVYLILLRRFNMKTKIKASKLIFSSLLIFMLAASVTFASNASNITVNFENLKYFIQGKQIKANPDTPGFIYQGTTYVPLRFIAESMGHSVDWNGKTKTITTKLDETETSYLQEIES